MVRRTRQRWYSWSFPCTVNACRAHRVPWRDAQKGQAGDATNDPPSHHVLRLLPRPASCGLRAHLVWESAIVCSHARVGSMHSGLPSHARARGRGAHCAHTLAEQCSQKSEEGAPRQPTPSERAVTRVSFSSSNGCVRGSVDLRARTCAWGGARRSCAGTHHGTGWTVNERVGQVFGSTGCLQGTCGNMQTHRCPRGQAGGRASDATRPSTEAPSGATRDPRVRRRRPAHNHVRGEPLRRHPRCW